MKHFLFSLVMSAISSASMASILEINLNIERVQHNYNSNGAMRQIFWSLAILRITKISLRDFQIMTRSVLRTSLQAAIDSMLPRFRMLRI